MYSRGDSEQATSREERLRFIRASVERLETLLRAAEAVRDEALMRELAEQSEAGRSALADLAEAEGTGSEEGPLA